MNGYTYNTPVSPTIYQCRHDDHRNQTDGKERCCFSFCKHCHDIFALVTAKWRNSRNRERDSSVFCWAYYTYYCWDLLFLKTIESNWRRQRDSTNYTFTHLQHLWLRFKKVGRNYKWVNLKKSENSWDDLFTLYYMQL